jgi:hypothetical protein
VLPPASLPPVRYHGGPSGNVELETGIDAAVLLVKLHQEITKLKTEDARHDQRLRKHRRAGGGLAIGHAEPELGHRLLAEWMTIGRGIAAALCQKASAGMVNVFLRGMRTRFSESHSGPV